MKLTIFFSVIFIAFIGAAIIGPIAQDPDYHKFADERTILSVPNFWNVMTNIPFVIVGLMGMTLLARGRATRGLPELRPIYALFFLGVFASGLGSVYYHYHPTNETLLWDRIPMTVSFMAFFSVVVGEHISIRVSRIIVVPLLALGIASALSWYVTEANGNGDLRGYALVQYLPVVLIPIILLLFESRLRPAAYIWAVLGAYVAAKIAESFDRPLFAALHIFSGHSVKHLAAALGAYVFYRAIQKESAGVIPAHESGKQ